jgi:hypothetical protein
MAWRWKDGNPAAWVDAEPAAHVVKQPASSGQPVAGPDWVDNFVNGPLPVDRLPRSRPVPPRRRRGPRRRG